MCWFIYGVINVDKIEGYLNVCNVWIVKIIIIIWGGFLMKKFGYLI